MKNIGKFKWSNFMKVTTQVVNFTTILNMKFNNNNFREEVRDYGRTEEPIWERWGGCHALSFDV